jgi:amidase
MELQGLSRRFVSRFGSDHDLLLTPTLATEPPKVGWIWEGAEDNPMLPMALGTPMGTFTAIFNISGLPAISLPVHMAPSGLPVGVQLVAPPRAEHTLIRLASALEERFQWQHRQAAI